MRKSTWLALGMVLVLSASARAQSGRGPGFFGFLPDLFGGQNFNSDPVKPPIPVQVRNTSPKLLDYIPKLNISLRRQPSPIMTLPDASQINQTEYLKAFHYQAPKPISFFGNN